MVSQEQQALVPVSPPALLSQSAGTEGPGLHELAFGILIKLKDPFLPMQQENITWMRSLGILP